MPSRKVLVVIPARYGSTRFRGKPLAVIGGVPMVVRTYKRALRIKNADSVVVATDDRRIERIVTDAGGTAVMTSSRHSSGTSRVAEAVRMVQPRHDIVINIQGDEPVFPIRSVERLIDLIVEDRSISMATIATRRITEAELFSRDVVKVVVDSDGYALYFSRSPIPYPGEHHDSFLNLHREKRSASILRTLSDERDVASSSRHGADGSAGETAKHRAKSSTAAEEVYSKRLTGFLKHIGIYGFRRNFLERFVALKRSTLEKRESLEQLRALENGFGIRVLTCSAQSISVDRPEDIKVVEKNIQTR